MLFWVSGGLPSIPVRIGEVTWPQLTPAADMGAASLPCHWHLPATLLVRAELDFPGLSVKALVTWHRPKGLESIPDSGIAWGKTEMGRAKARTHPRN